MKKMLWVVTSITMVSLSGCAVGAFLNNGGKVEDCEKLVKKMNDNEVEISVERQQIVQCRAENEEGKAVYPTLFNYLNPTFYSPKEE